MSITDGNSGSITGVSHTTETSDAVQNTKSSFFARHFQWIIGLAVIVGIGLFSLFSTITTPPLAVNPTLEPVTFEIDGKSYTVESDSSLSLDISHGEHTVTLGGKELGKFNFGWLDGESIVNPTLSAFVIENVLYVDTTKNYDDYADRVATNIIEVEGQKFTGPYEYIAPALYIKKDWDYGAYEESPEEVTLGEHETYTVKRELFLASSFVEYTCHDNDTREGCVDSVEENTSSGSGDTDTSAL